MKKVGDRVTRKLFMDDGTWWRNDDRCLKHSPLRHGIVIKVYTKDSNIDGLKWTNDVIDVQWDDGETRTYLHHGVSYEVIKHEN